MKAHTLDCGCRVDKHGRVPPLSMCPEHHILWEAHHSAAQNEHAAEAKRTMSAQDSKATD